MTLLQANIQIHHIKAERCRRSLFYFVKEFWNEINNVPYDHNWHIEFLCDKIQLALDKYTLNRPPHIPNDKWYEGITSNIRKNIVYCIPPGTSKSTILSRMAPAWLWCVDPGKTWISSTIDNGNATEFSRKTKDIINSEKYKLYFPETRIRNDASAVNFYQSTAGGTRFSLTTRGSNTGKHGDVISEDDAMSYPVAQSASEAAECIEGFKSLQTRKKDKSKTVYILGMQRLSSFDTVAHALKVLSDVDYICLPAEDIYNNIEPPALRNYYINGLLDPIKLSLKILEELKQGLNDDKEPMSDVAYQVQFNQVNQSLNALLYGSLNLVDGLPDNREGVIRFSFTDVADTGSDYFATAFFEYNPIDGRLYWFDSIYTQEGSNTTAPLLKERITQHRILINRMETNNQGSVYVTMLQNQGVNISGYYSKGNKSHRITSFAQFMKFVYVVKGGNEQHIKAVKHLQAYPKIGKAEDGHDDIEDAVTEFLRYIYVNYKHLFAINE